MFDIPIFFKKTKHGTDKLSYDIIYIINVDR